MTEVTPIEAGLRDRLRVTVREQLAADRRVAAGSLTAEDERLFAQSLVHRALAAHSERRVRAGKPPLSADVEQELVRQVVADCFGAGGLEDYLSDPTVTDVIAHGAQVVHVKHADGRRRRVAPIANSDEELVDLVRGLSRDMDARFDTASVEANFALADGSRVFAAVGVSPYPVVVVRRHHLHELGSLDDLVRVGMLEVDIAALLRAMVLGRQNVIVSGGPGTGKTTLCRAMCNEIPADQHVVTVEDTYELFLHRDRERHPMVTPFLARPANTEGAGEVSLAQLTRMGLRATPDRCVVGEVRGPEVIPLLEAMTQDSAGSLGTVHASSSRAAPTRLAAYAIKAGQLRLEDALFLVATAVDFVVHVARTVDGGRFVASVREISPNGADGLVLTSAEVCRAVDGRARFTDVPVSADRAASLESAGWQPDRVSLGRW